MSTPHLSLLSSLNLHRERLLSAAVSQRSAFYRYWNQLAEFAEEQFTSVSERTLKVLEVLEPAEPIRLPSNIKFVSLLDEAYPEILLELPQPPLGLFVAGDISILKAPYNQMSMVGSRRPTPYAVRLTRELGSVWAKLGLVIVSGGAIGIDRESHLAALDVGGKTVAILGGGHGRLHPASNRQLFIDIAKNGGAVISEYPPDFMPRPYTFVERNRLIAALGKILFLAQAHEKSGSLGTARAALDLGREVFVLQPPPADQNYSGSVALMESGAKAIISPQEIF